MKLLRKLGTRLSKSGRLVPWGEFLCPNPECNKIVEKLLYNGINAKSCGCERIKNIIRHGGKGTKLYSVWLTMKQRILNSNNSDYKDYGGRGITICPEWTDKKNGFINFREWSLNNGYQEGLEIDRKENEGNYEPSNCRWITHLENQRNRRSNKIKSLEQANEIRRLNNTGGYTQRELAEMYGVSETTIFNIIHNKKWRN